MKYIFVNSPSVKWINFLVILILCDYISSTSSVNGLLLNSSVSQRTLNGLNEDESYSRHLNFGDINFKTSIKNNSKRSIFRKIMQPFFGYDDIETSKILLLGLFELTTRSGLSELAAAKLAVKHVNEKNILNGYTLELKTNDTQCDAGVSVDRFFHSIYSQNKTKMIMVLGSACSDVTESLAKIVPYWSIVMVSFGSTSPALSDRDEFPFFFRTVMPDSAHNPARVSFIQYFKWDSVVTFSQKEEIYALAINDLVTQLERANISCTSTMSFSENDYKEQLKMLKDLDTRIIIGSFSDKMAAKVFCEAYHLGMFGDYVWILPESDDDSWWDFEKSNCTIKNIHDTIENVIFVSSFNNIVGHEKSISGITKERFEEELSAMNITKPYSRNILTTYDAIWSIALVLKNAEELWKNESEAYSMKDQKKLNHFDYNRIDIANDFVKQFAKLKFQGISGPVSFDGNDRIGITVFKQIQNSKRQQIALYHPEYDLLDFNCPFCSIIKWNNNVVPIAKRIFRLRYVTISNLAFFTISSFAVFGIILSIMFLAFNLHFRKLKSIKLSSYKLSNITAVGCIFIYGAVILLGLDHSSLPLFFSSFPTVCMARVYLLSAGFSLTFGSMFAKTYRVHRIFIHNWGGVYCRDKMLKDKKLISLICCLLLVDGLFVTCWTMIDPMQRNLRNLTLEISHTDRSVVYQPQVEVCESLNTKSWLLFLYAYKGLLLAVGVYMAWETRHVKIPALNDSKYIGISVYGAVITSVSVVVFANILADKVTIAFIIIATIILISTTATLCLVFVPKMSAILNKEIQEDAVIQSMGLKIECNTRRFAVDDKKELQYRVEVQNRVYLKELEALDAEIKSLEKMLENRSLSSTSSLQSIVAYVKPEIVIDDSSSICQVKSPRTSVTGTLPLLLLSVLPPVIPRASWPNAEAVQSPIRHSRCFNSNPQIPSNHGSNINIPAIDLLNLRLTQQQQQQNENENVGFLRKIKNLFGSKAPSRKESTTSLTTSHITSAIRSHVNMLTELFPNVSNSNNSVDREDAYGEGFKKASLFTINAVGDEIARDKSSRKHRIILTSSLSNIEESLKDNNEMNSASKWKSLEEEALYASSNKTLYQSLKF